ncbi:MAG: efflux RND transporter permease subunit [Phycisphaerae bacterium]|nr:efflux RND transporter permease subunit [Phycisphaerae bacterium]
MWLVELALRRTYTFIVMAMLIAILGGVTLVRMATDIFPEIDIPVVAVMWSFSGMPPEEMEQRIASGYERAMTTTVNDIEHIESQSLRGVCVVKVFFHPGAKIEAATAQITAISQSILRAFPPGITPPLIIRYNASNVPVLQAALGSNTLTEQQLFDLGQNFIRTGLATVQGAQITLPYGGKFRQIMVDLDLDKLHAWGLSPDDISAAVNAQNLIIPAGTAKVGSQEYNVRLNSSPPTVEEFNDLPIKTVNGVTLYMRDVAYVRDGFTPQTNVVHVDGKRAAVLPILKAGGASTLDIVDRVRKALPGVLATLPRELKVTLLFDQSVFVRAAINGVVKEAVIAAGLTGLMIMLFLGSWRSTIIVIISIPLSILTSISILHALGQTLNVMTLGGMALAVGILVDDATVAVENIHRNLGQCKTLVRAILDGSQQIAVPAFVSTLCICIVFTPIAFISGAAKYLFTPMAMAVVFAMLASYLLSRTLVPTMAYYLLRDEFQGGVKQVLGGAAVAGGRGIRGGFHGVFERQFEKLRRFYGGLLAGCLEHRLTVLMVAILLVAASTGLAMLIGRDFFPSVDAGQIRLHVRCPPGTRIEETERHFAKVSEVIREIIPPEETAMVLDNIGTPVSSLNLALSDGTLISTAEGEVLIALKPERRCTTPEYVKRLRRELAARFPDLIFFFQAADIATQVLNFGISAPIDIQIVGPRANQPENLRIAQAISREVAAIPGAVDVHLHQVVNVPELRVNVDRTLAAQLGLSQRDVANDMLMSLSGSGQTAPNFWLDPIRGVQYSIIVQTPQYKINSISALENTPITATGLNEPRLLSDVAQVSHSTGLANITHHNVARTLDVLVGVQDTDLGSVSRAVDEILDRYRPQLPRGSTVVVRGQVESMNNSFSGLTYGLVFAVLLVYLLMVVNFQSWVDPLIILMALPGALSGIVWMLFATGTTLNVPSLMGAIMSIGVATANSILVITFANDQRRLGMDAPQAALAAGMSRLRPVLMTALAMIMGMLPMSLGLSEGGEQNAPLGRAVVGGLAVATFATLFFVPVVYSVLRRRPPKPHVAELDRERP